jgi:hypothetical protein
MGNDKKIIVNNSSDKFDEAIKKAVLIAFIVSLILLAITYLFKIGSSFIEKLIYSSGLFIVLIIKSIIGLRIIISKIYIVDELLVIEYFHYGVPKGIKILLQDVNVKISHPYAQTRAARFIIKDNSNKKIKQYLTSFWQEEKMVETKQKIERIKMEGKTR